MKINSRFQLILGLGSFEPFPGCDLRDIWYNVKLSFRSFKRLFKVMWRFRSYDYGYTLDILKETLTLHLEALQDKRSLQEVDETRIPKEEDIKRCIQLITNLREDEYAERCGYDFNYDINFVEVEPDEKTGQNLYEIKDTTTKEQKENNNKALHKAHELESAEWKELFNIMRDNMQGWWT